jgi:dTDP-4-amino-4,6-dideoxygalactose transaminase
LYAADQALLVDSGTTALRVALEGAREVAGANPVALPAYSCYDLASAAVGAGIEVLLYDLDPRTLGPEESSLHRVLERTPGVLVLAHLFGYPVDWERIRLLARTSGVLVVEDAAQGAGGLLQGTLLGSFGSLTVLSFGRGKGITAGGGGALLARGEVGGRVLAAGACRVAEGTRGGREVAVLIAQWVFGRPGLYGVPASIPGLRLGETVYRPPHDPKGMSAAAAGALHVTLGHGAAEVEHRRQNARRLTVRARAGGRVHVPEPVAGSEPGYLRLPVLLQGDRDPALAAVGRLGIAPGYPQPLAEQGPLRAVVRNGGDSFPGAHHLAERLVTLPTHSRLAEEELAALEAWLS